MQLRQFGLTGLMAVRTIARRDSKGSCPKLIASNLPLTELASKRDLLRRETLCWVVREARKLR